MNLDLIYTVFGIILGVLSIAMIFVSVFQLSIAHKRKKLRASFEDPEPVEIESDDLTVRIKGAALDAFDTPEEKEEQAASPAAEDGFVRGEKLTFAQKYERLSPETRALLDAFDDYLSSQPDCSNTEQVGALLFRYKKSQIAKAFIRRDCVYLNFPILNPELGRMAREGRSAALKMKPVEIRLGSESELSVAEQTADLTLGYLKDEENYRSEKRKEARREAARQKREAEGAPDEEEEAEGGTAEGKAAEG